MKTVLTLMILNLVVINAHAGQACVQAATPEVCVIDKACVDQYPVYTLTVVDPRDVLNPSEINALDVSIHSKTTAYICQDDDFTDSINSKSAAAAVVKLTAQAQALKAGGICNTIIVNVQ